MGAIKLSVRASSAIATDHAVHRRSFLCKVPTGIPVVRSDMCKKFISVAAKVVVSVVAREESQVLDFM